MLENNGTLIKKTFINKIKSPKKEWVRNHGELSSISVSIIMEEKQIKNISKHSWSAHQAQITALIHWRGNETKDTVPAYQRLQLVRQYIHQDGAQDSPWGGNSWYFRNRRETGETGDCWENYLWKDDSLQADPQADRLQPHFTMNILQCLPFTIPKWNP